MMGEGWAHLHRDLRAEMGRDALIVDVRGNRGGHTSQLIVEKLARRIVGWKIPRHLRPYSYPQEARRGPLVALTDEFAGSDGDIVTAAIKTLGLGPGDRRPHLGRRGRHRRRRARPGRRHPDHHPALRLLVQPSSAGPWRTTALIPTPRYFITPDDSGGRPRPAA